MKEELTPPNRLPAFSLFLIKLKSIFILHFEQMYSILISMKNQRKNISFTHCFGNNSIKWYNQQGHACTELLLIHSEKMCIFGTNSTSGNDSLYTTDSTVSDTVVVNTPFCSFFKPEQDTALVPKKHVVPLTVPLTEKRFFVLKGGFFKRNNSTKKQLFFAGRITKSVTHKLNQ